MKFKLTFRITILIILLAFSFLSLFINSEGIAPLQKGVKITSVELNSTAYEQGLRQGQIIKSIDGERIRNLDDYSSLVLEKFKDNENKKIIIETSKTEIILFTNQAPEITVADVSKSNLKFGIDLSGGARALIKAQDKELSSEEVQDLVSITRNRLNEFGLTDLKVVPVSDLSGNNYMLVEIAGATPNDLEQMIAQQGKFEAKIGDEIVFIGGERDIVSVARSGVQSGVRECFRTSETTYACNFAFAVYLSEAAAQRHADITKELEINFTSQGRYLSEKLDLYLDDKLVDSLLIGESLKGVATTQISISGSGSGSTEKEAFDDAVKSMNKLQTILITGSLPYKLEISKLDTISPILGNNFLKLVLIAGASSLFAVAILIFIRYRKIKLSLALLFTSFSEVFIILGIASFISWNLDVLSIAGIIIAIGTGLDQQIIIMDETRNIRNLSIKERLKRAFAIIIGAYLTAIAALLPLLWAGAGLLKGFVFTTFIGITAGILITRPAFADLIKFIED